MADMLTAGLADNIILCNIKTSKHIKNIKYIKFFTSIIKLGKIQNTA